MNIYEKMSAITMEIERVAKNLQVGYGTTSYKAVSEGDVLRAVKPLEEKYKVYSYPSHRTIIESGILETLDKQGNPKKQLYMRVETTYRFVDMENPSDYIEVVTYGDGVDSQDKASGKGMTYADKYALLKAYKIETGDDPDKDASETLKSATTTKKTPKADNSATPSVDWRRKLIDKLNELGIDAKQYAVEHQINGSTTQEGFKKEYESLCKM